LYAHDCWCGSASVAASRLSLLRIPFLLLLLLLLMKLPLSPPQRPHPYDVRNMVF